MRTLWWSGYCGKLCKGRELEALEFSPISSPFELGFMRRGSAEQQKWTQAPCLMIWTRGRHVTQKAKLIGKKKGMIQRLRRVKHFGSKRWTPKRIREASKFVTRFFLYPPFFPFRFLQEFCNIVCRESGVGDRHSK